MQHDYFRCQVTVCSLDRHQMNVSVSLLFASYRKVALNSTGFIHAWLPPQCRLRGRGRRVYDWRRLWRPRTDRHELLREKHRNAFEGARAHTVQEQQRTKKEGTHYAVVRRVMVNTKLVDDLKNLTGKTHEIVILGAFWVLWYRLDKLSNRMLACGTTRHRWRKNGVTRANSAAANPPNPLSLSIKKR